MSSLNIKKLKQTDLKPLLKHCDKHLRPKAVHSNIHINPELTKQNEQLRRSYEETCKLFDDTIADLDQRPKANRRVDRVVAYAIEGPLPPTVEEDTEKNNKMYREWIKGIYKILRESYPEMLLLQYYVHVDEQHPYMNPETGETVMSRPHVHLFVMPIIEGKLNGKKFFQNRKSYFEFNRKLDELTVSIYGRPYGDGTKKKSLSTVEQLKIESEKAELEARRKAAQDAEKDLINREVALRQQEKIIEEREQETNRREAKMMAFINSEIGKKAMQEYDAVVRRNSVTQLRGKKQGGKIKVTMEKEAEIK